MQNVSEIVFAAPIWPAGCHSFRKDTASLNLRLRVSSYASGALFYSAWAIIWISCMRCWTSSWSWNQSSIYLRAALIATLLTTISKSYFHWWQINFRFLFFHDSLDQLYSKYHLFWLPATWFPCTGCTSCTDCTFWHHYHFLSWWKVSMSQDN